MNDLITTDPGTFSIPDDPNIGALIEAIGGDISKLPAEQRLKYIAATCKSVGLNPLTKPFDLITFQGKTQGLNAWSRDLGLNKESIRARLDKWHWPLERALTLGDTRWKR